MIKKTICVFLLIGLCISLKAQTNREAEDLFNAKQFDQALSAYQNLLARNPQSVLYQYRYARCHFELGNSAEAIKYFELAGERYPLRNFYLGELYFADYRFEEASELYQKFLTTIEPNDERVAYLHKRVSQCEKGARLLHRVEEIIIVDSILINKDAFIGAYELSLEAGGLETMARTSNNSLIETVVFTNQRNDRKYYSDLNGDNLDIFTTYKLLDEWTEPELLPGTINTKSNENFPFVLSDGVTMYFASDNEESLGGYDIFITRYNANTNTYLASENIGMPFNSPANDYMMVIDEVQNLGWFATDRNAPAGKVTVYMFKPNGEKQIIRSQNETYIRSAAQLKTYKKETKQRESAQTEIVTTLQSEPDFVFVVTEGIVYNLLSDFRSKEAAQAFRAAMQAENQLQNQETQLQAYRYQYATANTNAEKRRITPVILNIEHSINELTEKMDSYRKQARQLELDWLIKRQK